jgi:hypothetical protein
MIPETGASAIAPRLHLNWSAQFIEGSPKPPPLHARGSFPGARIARSPDAARCSSALATQLVSAEVAHQGAHQTMHLPHDAEAEAERQKMARLRKLRLEQEAAEKLGVTLRPDMAVKSQTVPQERPTKHTRNNRKATPSPSNGRTSGSTPMTLSEWRAQKERNGGRY